MANETTAPLEKKHAVWSTYVIAALMVYVYGCERHAMAWGIMDSFLNDYAFHWTGFLSDPWRNAPQLIAYTFMHADPAHLIGNLAFFLFFAPSVEQVVGAVNFALLYFCAGAVAALTNGYVEPFVQNLIGASGAISGVIGAYFVLFPLRTPSGRWMGPFFRKIPVFVWIGLWLAIQIRSGFDILLPSPFAGNTAQVAYWAHAGGFMFGGLAMLPAIVKR